MGDKKDKREKKAKKDKQIRAAMDDDDYQDIVVAGLTPELLAEKERKEKKKARKEERDKRDNNETDAEKQEARKKERREKKERRDRKEQDLLLQAQSALDTGAGIGARVADSKQDRNAVISDGGVEVDPEMARAARL